MSVPHPPLSRAAPLPAAPLARGVVVHPHTAAAAAAAAPPGPPSWPTLPAHAPALPVPVPAPVADVLLPSRGGVGGSGNSSSGLGRFPLPQQPKPQPQAAAALAPPAPPAPPAAIPSPNPLTLPLPLPSPLPPPPPAPQPPPPPAAAAAAPAPAVSQCSGAAAVRSEVVAATAAAAAAASSSTSAAAAAALGCQTQERRRSRHIVDDLLVVIDTLLALLPLDSLFTLRHTCSRMRNVASAKMGLHTVGLILDHLGASVGGGPVFLSGAGSPCDAEHPVTRFVATGGGHLRWAQQTSAAEPPPSQLFIPFNGFSMTAFWGLVPYITQGMFNSDMWDMMTTPEEVRKYVHGTWTAFHKHEVAELPRQEALATLKVWGLLEALLASLTRSYRFHNVYVELRSLDPGSRRSIQMRPLLYEKA